MTLSIAARLDVLAAFEAIVDARLREREAEILAAQVAGYTYVEIGLAKWLTPGTVKRQLPRAKRKLRDARRRLQPDAATSAGEREIVGWRAERAVARTCWRRLRPRLQGGRQRPVRRAARLSGARRAQLRGDVGDLKCASPGRIRISGLANGLCHERVTGDAVAGQERVGVAEAPVPGHGQMCEIVLMAAESD